MCIRDRPYGGSLLKYYFRQPVKALRRRQHGQFYRGTVLLHLDWCIENVPGAARKKKLHQVPVYFRVEVINIRLDDLKRFLVENGWAGTAPGKNTQVICIPGIQLPGAVTDSLKVK